ncbi:MAG: dynamin family protein, partial [Leucobacter sp.]
MTHPTPTAARLSALITEMTDASQRAGRPDLAERLSAAATSVADASVRVVIVGQFKQGKSALVNALVTAEVCPIDDVLATSVPTSVRWGEQLTATLVTELTGEREVIRTAIDPGDLRAHVTELAGDAGTFGNLHAEVTLPRKVLEAGLVLVDTPGVGRTQSRAATNLTLLPQADVVVVVTDATQELTEPELAFLSHAAKLCPRLTCVVSKSDLQHNWRAVVEANTEHLNAAGIDAPMLVTSAVLHNLAAQHQDRELLEEAGVTSLARHLHGEWKSVLGERYRLAAEEIRSVGGLLSMVLNSEL